MLTSLREWAINNQVWKPKSWKPFLTQYILPFYKVAYTLNEFYSFLQSNKIIGKPSLADIEDEDLKDKIRAAIYGGVDQNPETSFAKFMYERFGLCAEKAQSFEESIEHYRSWGDSVKISIIDDSWISKIPIDGLVNRLDNLIRWELREKLDVKLSELGLKESYEPVETIDVANLLPKPGEKPEKLISLINEFRQRAVDLAIGANPFTTFIHYVRAIPVSVLMKFLECDINDVTSLASFLELKAYSMIDLVEVKLPTKNPDKVFLIAELDGLADKVLSLHKYLERIEPTTGEVFIKMVKDAIDQLKIPFEPWEDYEPIFTFWNKILKDRDYFYLEVRGSRSRITKLYSYYNKVELSKKVWLRDFLIRLYPAISTGIIEDCKSLTSLRFSPFAKEWVGRVIENAGKA